MNQKFKLNKVIENQSRFFRLKMRSLFATILPLIILLVFSASFSGKSQAQSKNSPTCRVYLTTAGKYNPSKIFQTSAVERNAKRCRQACYSALKQACAAVGNGATSNLLVTKIRIAYDKDHPACQGVDVSDYINPYLGAARSPDGYYYAFCGNFN